MKAVTYFICLAVTILVVNRSKLINLKPDLNLEKNWAALITKVKSWPRILPIMRVRWVRIPDYLREYSAIWNFWDERKELCSDHMDSLPTPVASNRQLSKSSLLADWFGDKPREPQGGLDLLVRKYICPMYCTGCTVLSWAQRATPSFRRVHVTQVGNVVVIR